MSRSHPPAPPGKQSLHPRNRHQGHYDFPALIRNCPELARFVIRNPHGKSSIDFASPDAVRTLNRALLAQQYRLRHWDLPPGYLCPPIPGRADYIHHLADLLASDAPDQALPKGRRIRILDIGVGANCIYPLLGQIEYGWRFLGSEVDATALASARTLVQANGLADEIHIKRQTDSRRTLEGIIAPGDYLHASLCNPPFHSSPEEARQGSQRKWRNLGRQDPDRKLPALNFGGRHHELWCPGGEAVFLRRMAQESRGFAEQVGWFTTLVAKGGHVSDLKRHLKKLQAVEVRVITMGQGRKISRLLAWSFQSAEQRRDRLPIQDRRSQRPAS